MILADTSYFIALFNPGDALHGRALTWSRSVLFKQRDRNHVPARAWKKHCAASQGIRP